LVARVAEGVSWLQEVSQSAPETQCVPVSSVEVSLAREAVEHWQAGRKALDEMRPFHLRFDLAKGRVVRIDRRRPDGPHGKVEGGVRLPLSGSHAVDIIAAGAPPGLEIVVAEIAGDRPVRYLRYAQVCLQRGRRRQTSSTDPTGRVRLEMPKRGEYLLEVVYSLLGEPLLGKVKIEVV